MTLTTARLVFLVLEKARPRPLIRVASGTLQTPVSDRE
jgi:hypothetical protein